jgi:hypothetical protein
MNARGGRAHQSEQEWRCIHCGFLVSGAPTIAGVRNRNHCPYCLWSRHLDWRVAGDRLSACRNGMEPIGLTTKRSRNKYAHERDGELMVVHRCTHCATIVINRVAADDCAATLCELFAASGDLDAATQCELAQSDVVLLGQRDAELVRRRLFGERARESILAFTAGGD